MKKYYSGQSIVEYGVLLLVVAMAVGGMKMYLTRSVKAQFKLLQEQVTGKSSGDVIDKAKTEPDDSRTLPNG